MQSGKLMQRVKTIWLELEIEKILLFNLRYFCPPNKFQHGTIYVRCLKSLEQKLHYNSYEKQ